MEEDKDTEQAGNRSPEHQVQDHQLEDTEDTIEGSEGVMNTEQGSGEAEEEERRGEAGGVKETNSTGTDQEVFLEVSSTDEDEHLHVQPNSNDVTITEDDDEETHFETNEDHDNDAEGVSVVDQRVLKSLNDYILKIEMEPISVSIEPYRSKRKAMRLTKTIVYQLEVQFGETGLVIWREYDEFALLVKYLHNRFKSAIVPPLPAAFSAITSVTDSMLEKRLLGLRSFMNALLRHPFLSRDKAVDLFLRSTGPLTKKALEALMKESTEGHSRFNELISLVSSPKKPSSLLKEVHKELSTLNSFYALLLKEVKALSAKLLSYATTLRQYNSAIEHWRQIEHTELPEISGSISVRTESSSVTNTMLCDYLKQMETANSLEHKLVLDRAKRLIEITKAPIKYEMLVIESMMKDVEKVKEYISRYNKTCKLLKDLEVEQFRQQPVQEGGGSTQSNLSSDPALAKKINAAVASRESAKAEMDVYVRGLLVLELHRYRFERGGRAASILKSLAELKGSLFSTAATEWTRLGDALPSETLSIGSDIVLLSKIESTIQTEPATGKT